MVLAGVDDWIWRRAGKVFGIRGILFGPISILLSWMHEYGSRVSIYWAGV